MKWQPGLSVVLTGANGGLGAPMTAALAARGARLTLVAYPGVGLDELRASAVKQGAEAQALILDLSKPEGRVQTVEAARRAYGGIDVLINNAGVEHTDYYDALPLERIQEMVAVNLEAPLWLTRLALPEMLQRGRGHIVNISSLARSGPAFQETYGATKAALRAFTLSLRASYAGRGVSASVVCPGFVEAGVYTRLKRQAGRPAPWLLGAVPPERVARAVCRAVAANRAEIIVSRVPVRPLLALMELFPAFGAWLGAQLGANDFFRQALKDRPVGRNP